MINLKYDLYVKKIFITNFNYNKFYIEKCLLIINFNYINKYFLCNTILKY